jgi:large subunit ribosomal protein L4
MATKKTFDLNITNVEDGTVQKSKVLALTISTDNSNYIIHRALKHQNVLAHQYTSSSKTRSEVRGGGRKPWKQKGTGRARAGSNRSPLWKGGGVIFGPKPKTIYKKINKKEKQLALQTAIYNKQSQISVFNKFELDEPKTAKFLQNLNLEKNQEKTLIISSVPNKNLQLAVKNLTSFDYILANQLNVTEIVKAQKIIIDEPSFQIIKETYCD